MADSRNFIIQTSGDSPWRWTEWDETQDMARLMGKWDSVVKKESKMKDIIVKNFPKTEDAVLVQRYLSESLPSDEPYDFCRRLVLEAVPNWQEKILTEAKRLDEKAKKKA